MNHVTNLTLLCSNLCVSLFTVIVVVFIKTQEYLVNGRRMKWKVIVVNVYR